MYISEGNIFISSKQDPLRMFLQSYQSLTTLGVLGSAFLIFIFTLMDLILLIHMENLLLVSCFSDKGNWVFPPSLSSLLASPSSLLPVWYHCGEEAFASVV